MFIFLIYFQLPLGVSNPGLSDESQVCLPLYCLELTEIRGSYVWIYKAGASDLQKTAGLGNSRNACQNCWIGHQQKHAQQNCWIGHQQKHAWQNYWIGHQQKLFNLSYWKTAGLRPSLDFGNCPISKKDHLISELKISLSEMKLHPWVFLHQSKSIPEAQNI